jgi:hypothetical protein
MKCAYKIISKQLIGLSTFSFTFTIGFGLRDITRCVVNGYELEWTVNDIRECD